LEINSSFYVLPSPDGSGNPFSFCCQKEKDYNVQQEIAPENI